MEKLGERNKVNSTVKKQSPKPKMQAVLHDSCIAKFPEEMGIVF